MYVTVLCYAMLCYVISHGIHVYIVQYMLTVRMCAHSICVVVVSERVHTVQAGVFLHHVINHILYYIQFTQFIFFLLLLLLVACLMIYIFFSYDHFPVIFFHESSISSTEACQPEKLRDVEWRRHKKSNKN